MNRLCMEAIHSGYERGHDIVRGASCTLYPGRFTIVLGANGCGKTTFLKSVLGLMPVRRGRVRCGDNDLLVMTEKERAKRVAYIPQEHSVPYPFQIEDVVRMGRTPHLRGVSRERAEDVARARAAMETVGIDHLAKTPYNRISGGQRQLVLIARALAQEAPYLIMDEPTGNLDYGNQYRVLRIIQNLCDTRQLGVLMVTHDPAHCFYVGDEILMMQDGVFIEAGIPAEVLQEEKLAKIYRLPTAIRSVRVDGRSEQVCIPRRAERGEE
ncbi:MAG: ABC transporter ATP-binding protein [Eubacteriales bacterium]|nr:ABC transporter ATP-binding protein [Eubacteriales bacterium]